jgi:serine/threonine protein kinase
MSAMTFGDLLPSLDRYEVVREIGRGGMAVVWLARQTDLDRDVALKELRVFGETDPAAARRFVQESRVAAALTHPNVVTVHDYFEQDATPYIAMEYLARGSLRSYVGRTSVAENVGVLEGLLAGLDHAARLGVVHRDIKPENVLITAEGRVKIADFGIAKADRRLDQGSLLTMQGVPVGTPSYMAPEQVAGGEVGPWTDLFSVGVVAWELFVGHTPFRDTPSPMGILLRNVNEAIPSAQTAAPAVDPDISAWIDRLLVKDASGRTQSASEAWDELEEIATGVLGPSWRRLARLRIRTSSSAVRSPLTPAPFTGPTGPTNDAGVRDDRAALVGAETSSGGPLLSAVATAPEITNPEPPAAVADAPTPPVPPGLVVVRPAPRRPWTEALVGLAEHRPILAPALAVLAAITAIAAGWVAGSAGGSAAARPSLAENDGLRLTIPAGWQRLPVGSAPRLPGLARTGAVIAGPDATGRTGIEANLVSYAPPSLLSRRMGTAVQGRLPAPVAVTLGGGVQAYRYDRLHLVGHSGVVTVYAVPTTDWVATLACFAPPGGDRDIESACAGVAATLRPTTSRPVPVGPSATFGDQVANALTALRAATTAPGRALVHAVDARDQAKAASRLARAYGEAATTLENLPDRVVDGAAIAGLAAGMSTTANAYDGLASAARAGSLDDYERARRALTGARSRLREARRTFARGGYETR